MTREEAEAIAREWATANDESLPAHPAKMESLTSALMAIAERAAKEEREACARDFDTEVDALPDAHWYDPAGVSRLQDFIRNRSKS